MYIDGFHFSPFEINKNVVSIWIGEFIIEDNKIYHKHNLITPQEFYDLFIENAQGTWFVQDFIEAFSNKKNALPEAIGEFAIYCEAKSQLFSPKKLSS